MQMKVSQCLGCYTLFKADLLWKKHVKTQSLFVYAKV